MNKESLMQILTSISGNALEWYDFALYGYFASVISKLFFPTSNNFLSLLLTFGVFASGFIIRPFGGAIFGSIGDRFGRRTALLASIALITIPTTLIGLLPTYQSIGITAPIVLTMLRFFQGAAVSGELTGSGTFLTECAPIKRKGLYGSLVMCSTYIGLLVGSMMGFLITVFFSTKEIISYAWRIPFFCALPIGIVALLLRLKCSESPKYLKVFDEDKILKKPIAEVFLSYPLQLIQICLLSSTLAVSIYLMIGYLPSFFVAKMHVPMKISMFISLLGLLFLTILVPFKGFLSDFFNKKIIFGIGAMGFVLFSYTIFNLNNHHTVLYFLFSEILIALFLAPIAGTLITILCDCFPTNVRYTGVSIGYNMSMAIFGGTTPLIALFLTKHFHTMIAPAYYLIFVGVITLGALFFIGTKDNAYY